MRWEEYCIADLCTLVTDGAHNSPKEVSSGYPMASSKDMMENDFDMSNVKQISENDYSKLVKGNCKPEIGDVLIIKDGNSYLKYIFAVKEDRKMVLLSSIAILRPNQQIVYPTFLQYNLRSPEVKKEMENYVSGAAIPRIVLKDFKSMRTKVPPLPIQKKIASILSAYDDLIENNLKRIKLLEEAAQNIYKEWFVNFRFPGWKKVKLVEGLPEGWRKEPCTNIAEFLNGFAFKPFHWKDKGIPIIKIRELKDGITNDTPRNDGADVPKKYWFDNGAIIFSWSAHLDVYYWFHGEALLNQHLFNVVPFDETNIIYVFYALKALMPEFRNRANGATMKHIKRSALSEVFMILPNIMTIQKFDSIIRPILEQIENLHTQSQKLKEARDILLPRLMGRVIEV